MREQEERTSVAADGDPKQSVPDPSGGTGLRSLVVLLSICNVCCGGTANTPSNQGEHGLGA
jgi:hypothetical protein